MHRGIERHRDVVYGPHPAHRLDVYRQIGEVGPRPALLYVHGGGFRALSKDTHQLMALAFARRGWVVFNVEYRLAPEHAFPAGLTDVSRAWKFLLEHREKWGVAENRFGLAGESAGANLVTALTLMTVQRREEAFAREVFELGVVPRVVLPMCGVLQVQDAARFGRRRRIPWYIRDVLEDVEASLLGGAADESSALASPLMILEASKFERPLPAFYAAVGTRDPLLDDTRRLEAALKHHRVMHQIDYFPGELHAFHAFMWRTAARECWRNMLRFAADAIGDDPNA